MNAPDHIERFGFASNQDLILVVLGAVVEFPGRQFHTMPLRKPVDYYNWAEMVVRLELVGCVVQAAPRKYQPTERGTRVLQNYRTYGTNFHTSFLLAYIAMSPSPDTTVLKVAIRIAALVHQGLATVVGKRAAPTLTEGEFGFLSPPLTRGRAHHGMIWFALGAFIKGEMEDFFDLGSEKFRHLSDTITVGPMGLSRVQCACAKALVEQLDSDHGIPPAGDYLWASVPLTVDQTKTIDMALFLSWMHQTVWIRPNPDLVRHNDPQRESVADLASSARCQVDFRTEFLDVARLRKENDKHTLCGGVPAIYMTLEAHENNTVSAQMLTAVQPHCAEEFNQNALVKWPDAVANAHMF